MIKTVFFPSLKRREAYKLSNRGGYYLSYAEYRQEIREDCLGRCVYCDCHENEVGGAEHMNLDHFFPYELFKTWAQINYPTNLVWACGACNRYKSDDWPTGSTDECFTDDGGYLNPFDCNKWEYFELQDNGNLKALKHPATYMIIKLELNRESRLLVRQQRLDIISTIGQLSEQIALLEQKETLNKEEQDILTVFKNVHHHQINRLNFDLIT